MYADTGLMLPYFHNFPQQVLQFEDFGCSLKPNASSDTPSSTIQASAIPDFNLWGEGDLFSAPEPVIQEPVIDLDPMTAAISMISYGEDIIPTQSLTMPDIESPFERWQLLSEVFYECGKDILAKEGNETPLSEVLSINIPPVKTDDELATDEKVLADGIIQKSISSSFLRSMGNFLDFHIVDFGAVYGMRRAFSEGDIMTLSDDNISPLQSPVVKPRAIGSCISEERREKLSRYWSKKSKRNFGRKIKYACRKALADSQPRIRGRFAKTEETEAPKKL